MSLQNHSRSNGPVHVGALFGAAVALVALAVSVTIAVMRVSSPAHSVQATSVAEPSTVSTPALTQPKQEEMFELEGTWTVTGPMGPVVVNYRHDGSASGGLVLYHGEGKSTGTGKWKRLGPRKFEITELGLVRHWEIRTGDDKSPYYARIIAPVDGFVEVEDVPMRANGGENGSSTRQTSDIALAGSWVVQGQMGSMPGVFNRDGTIAGANERWRKAGASKYQMLRGSQVLRVWTLTPSDDPSVVSVRIDYPDGSFDSNITMRRTR